MRGSKTAVVLVAALAPLFARRPAAQEPAAEPPAILELATSHRLFAERTASLLGFELGLDGLGDRPSYRVVLRADRSIDASGVDAAATRVVELRLKPGDVLEAYRDELDVWLGLLRGVAFMSFTNAGVEPRHVGRMYEAVLGFPAQVAELELTVDDDGDELAFDLWLAPKPGTWFSKVVAGIEPDPRGAPRLRSPDMTLQVAVAARGPGVATLLEPFVEHLVAVRAQDRAERERFAAVAAERLPLFDGSFALMIDGPGRYVRLVGLRDYAAYAELEAAPDGRRFDSARFDHGRVRYAEPEVRALEDRAVWRVERVRDDEDETERDVGELATFSALAERYSVTARLPRDGEEVARLLDRAERGGLRPLPLLDSAFARVELRLPKSLSRIGPLLEGLELGPGIEADLDQQLRGTFAAMPESVVLTLREERGRWHVHGVARR